MRALMSQKRKLLLPVAVTDDCLPFLKYSICKAARLTSFRCGHLTDPVLVCTRGGDRLLMHHLWYCINARAAVEICKWHACHVLKIESRRPTLKVRLTLVSFVSFLRWQRSRFFSARESRCVEFAVSPPGCHRASRHVVPSSPHEYDVLRQRCRVAMGLGARTVRCAYMRSQPRVCRVNYTVK